MVTITNKEFNAILRVKKQSPGKLLSELYRYKLQKRARKRSKNMTDTEEQGTLKIGEVHPMAHFAMQWFRLWQADIKEYALTREAIASTALSGNRTAEILNSTLDRLEKGEPVSDRYLLGLCWYLKEAQDMKIWDPEDDGQPQKT